MLVSFLIWSESGGSEEGGFILPRSVIITGDILPQMLLCAQGLLFHGGLSSGLGEGVSVLALLTVSMGIVSAPSL